MLTFVKGKIDLSDKTLPVPAEEPLRTIKSLKMPRVAAELESVLPTDAFGVHGLSLRNRVPGAGALILIVIKQLVFVSIFLLMKKD